MIVTCEACSTKFRLDAGRLKQGVNKMRCSRCGHVFTVEQDEDDDLFSSVDPDEDQRILDEDSMGPASLSGFSPAGTTPARKSIGRWISLGIALIFAVGLIGLAIRNFSHSPSGDSASERPASSVSEQPSITIPDSTKVFFMENAHVGQLFVVEGEATNDSPKPVSFILLEGKLYTANRQVAQSQRCYSGNVMTREELAKLNVTEIQNRMMNREGKNLSNVTIQPGKRVPFMLVFHNLPELHLLNDYSIEVISAKIE